MFHKTLSEKKSCILYDLTLGVQLLDVWSLGLLKSIALFRLVIAVDIYCCTSASHNRLLGLFFFVALLQNAGHGLLNS